MKIAIKRNLSLRALSIKDIYTYFIALLPIIMVYNTPVIEMSIGTVGLLLFLPYSVSCLGKKYHYLNQSVVWILLVLYMYFIARSHGEFRTILLYASAFIHLCAFCVGSIDAKKIRSLIENIAVICTVCVIVQVLSHYVMGRNISFTILSALQRDYKAIYFEQTYRFSLYRPSGLFLEPAMLSEYCIFSLISCLFPADGVANKKRAMFIVAGIVLTTSGIGIVLSFAVYGWYVFLNRESFSKRMRRVFTAILLLPILFYILTRFGFFNAAIDRIFSNYEGYNALEGRTWRWSQALSPMKGQLLWLGYGATEDFSHYLTGIPDTIYRCGLIAVIIEMVLLIKLVFTKNNTFVRLTSIVFIVLLFVAKITSVPYQVFFIGLMLIELCAHRTRLLE